MSDFRDLLNTLESIEAEPQVGDFIDIELGDTLIETYITDITEDGVVVQIDETALKIMIDAKKQLNEWMKMGADSDASAAGSFAESYAGAYAGVADKIITYAKARGGMDKNDFMKAARILKKGDLKAARNFAATLDSDPRDYLLSMMDDLNEEVDIDEAEYKGRKVPLGKPMKGDVAKSKVYVRGPKGNVVKVNFGDKNMKIKKNIPARRKSFRARHNCDNPGPRWKARYWSCRAW